MRFCKKCNIKYEDDQNFCYYCGSPTKEYSEQKICSCGGVNEAEAKFCNYCGKKFQEEVFEEPIPSVKTGSWAKTLISIGVAFIILTAVCLII